MSTSLMIRGRTVIEETSRLLKQIRFSANTPAYIEGAQVAICVDPRWRDDDGAIEAMVTCFALDAASVDWEGLRINIDHKDGGHGTTWLAFLNGRGQTARKLPTRGEYSISLPYYTSSKIFRQAIHPPIRARGSAELLHHEPPEMLPQRFAHEGHSLELALTWKVEETDDGNRRLSIRTTDEAVAGKSIVFTLVESDSGRMLRTGEAPITLISEPYRWVSIGSIGENNIFADLVLQPR